MSAAPMAVPARIAPGEEDEIPRLAEAFEQARLGHAEWTHRAHLLVALWYASRLPADAALDAMRAGIHRLNAAQGVVTTPTRGYHETITRAYMRLIGDFAARCPAGESWTERGARLLAEHGERDHLLRYYSRERLMSPDARYGWVEPDLRPLP